MKLTYAAMLLFGVLFSTHLFPSFEELVFSTQLDDFSLYGNLSERRRITSVLIQHYIDNAQIEKLNCTARFRAKHCKNEIYFKLEISDNGIVHDSTKEWYEQDTVVLYLDFSSNEAPQGVTRVILNQDRVQVQNHDTKKDPCNSYLSSKTVRHQFNISKNVSIYEVVIILS